MSGFELSLIIKHQSMQLQMDDPIRDDFYHHFWQMKGGRSQAAYANLLAAAKKGVAKRVFDGVAPTGVTASLGVATVASRSKVEVVRTPRPLIQFAKPAEASSRQVEGAGDAAAVTTSMMTADRWVLRQRIDEARDVLTELRVHASSAAVMTPPGQQRRLALLATLFDKVQRAGGGGEVEPKLFLLDKGKKLLADLLGLWPPPQVLATLLAFAQQLPPYLQHKVEGSKPGSKEPPHVPAFANVLASAPKQLAPDDAASLLEAVTAHGAETLRAGLFFPELCALLLGLLCHPAAAAPDTRAAAALGGFYALLLPLAATSEAVWSFLGAVLPSSDAAHVAVLAAQIGELPEDAMSAPCIEAREGFVAKLQQHQPTGGAPAAPALD